MLRSRLIKSGRRVATIDLELAAKELYQLYREPAGLGRSAAAAILRPPIIFALDDVINPSTADDEATASATLSQAVDTLRHSHDFIVIDTPGHYSRSHAAGPCRWPTSLITPLNDSFVDFDVLGAVDPETFGVTGDQSLRQDRDRRPRHQRRLAGQPPTDWIVLRNRLSMLEFAQQASRRRQPATALADSSISASSKGWPSG